MKKIIFFVLLIVISSCDSKKLVPKQDLATALKSKCPTDGTCTVELLKNKQLDVQLDEFGSTYYQLSESLQTSVILYRYKKTPPTNVEDGHYTEEVLFEIENSNLGLSLTDIDLQKTKMIFGRLCFCRGQTGYYKVTNGNLYLQKSKNRINFTLNFRNTKFPQILDTIVETIN